jgi:hypothetical protein
MVEEGISEKLPFFEISLPAQQKTAKLIGAT